MTQKNEKGSIIDKIKNEVPVQKMRADESEKTIMTPPTEEEVKTSVKELNLDDDSADRG